MSAPTLRQQRRSRAPQPPREDHPRAGRRPPVGARRACCASAATPATQSSVSRDLRELGVAKQGDRYVLREAASAPKNDFSTLRQFVDRDGTAGTNLTVLKTTDRLGAERRRRDRHRPLARGRRHHFRRRHDIHRHRSAPRPTQARASSPRNLRNLNFHDIELPGGRRAHPSRILRRPRHLVLRAVAHRNLPTARSSPSPSTPAASTRRPRSCSPSDPGSWARSRII